jgi:hypothetical protein
MQKVFLDQDELSLAIPDNDRLNLFVLSKEELLEALKAQALVAGAKCIQAGSVEELAEKIAAGSFDTIPTLETQPDQQNTFQATPEQSEAGKVYAYDFTDREQFLNDFNKSPFFSGARLIGVTRLLKADGGGYMALIELKPETV